MRKLKLRKGRCRAMESCDLLALFGLSLHHAGMEKVERRDAVARCLADAMMLLTLVNSASK